MSSPLYWQTFGAGPDVVFLHGWGMNGAIWQQTAEQLSTHFRVHIVDLPGYGHSHEVSAGDLSAIVGKLLDQAPPRAVWVGWSLGGLIASHMAATYPQRVSQLITVASSPKFAAERPWRGIQPQVLASFTQQLQDNFEKTIEQFMALQVMGSPSAREDVKRLKQAVLSRPFPNERALHEGLQLLAECDLRQQLTAIQQPFLRMYGRLDGLVPVKVAQDLDMTLPDSSSVIMTQSAHAPFITEPHAFCQEVSNFITRSLPNGTN
ncbi:MAG: pimeloyl-ACP methyl ester esterase BioH [Vibrio sp.]